MLKVLKHANKNGEIEMCSVDTEAKHFLNEDGQIVKFEEVLEAQNDPEVRQFIEFVRTEGVVL